jgi:hypothetical protein
MVHYRCKHCRNEHPLLLPFAEKLYFDAAATLDLELECPEKKARGQYNKTDLVWKEEPEPQAVT